ncbi:hypothetical protein BaRGS_00011051 [Batillaria attramentaria]|uniref:Uncharacterized protein n=1 Tax=Batillaria attramentaria TaxID=370345 RepID=A0ABD0LER0_9CAEN
MQKHRDTKRLEALSAGCTHTARVAYKNSFLWALDRVMYLFLLSSADVCGPGFDLVGRIKYGTVFVLSSSWCTICLTKSFAVQTSIESLHRVIWC